ncbi:ribosome biogenesis GTPase YqeH [Mycoplasma yeatsii]|uniref:Ribosome biogenesis GTPase YqeH n=1 Tax=Mycoplasma yeatsii TaxID=51365 RepID=A0ABU0NG70_9MOLU|nr:ribosome biogenesis GTPase YqeH [Mycoplasma yeatsii]MDQ0568107.1 ribosome biogenesis GTPase YqeH [Mycoplasma yeatsii]
MKKCLGCGSSLQQENKTKIGYVENTDHAYCLRCFKIKNYNELVSNEIDSDQFIEKIKNLVETEKDLIFYYVLDVFDIEGSRIKNIEEIIKDHKVKLVVNKIDLLPKSVKLSKIKNYISDLFKDSNLNDLDVLLVSAKTMNLSQVLFDEIKNNNQYKQYFIGASNVGKSSLINKMLEMNNLVPSIVVSNYFNTTLDFISIKLDQNTVIYDSAGVSRKNSIANLMNKRFWKYCYFKKELKQFTYRLNTNNSIFFAGVAWFDYQSESKTDFHIYVNKNINLHRTSSNNVERYWNKNRKTLTPYISSQKVYSYKFDFTKNDINKEFDISISGLGWINFVVKQAMSITINIPGDEKSTLVTLRKPLI